MNPQEETIIPDPPEKQSTSGFVRWMVWLIFILLIAITSVGVYYGYSLILHKDKVDLIISEIHKKQDAQYAGLRPVQSELSRHDQAISEIKRELKKNNDDSFEQYYEILHKKIQRLEHTEKDNNAEWTISEVDYLLRIAQYRLYFLNDVRTTISILDEANDRLKSENGTDWPDLRHQISEKISELHALSGTSQEDLLSRLDELDSELKKFILLPGTQPQQEEKKEPQKVTERIWHEFRDIISIKKHDKPAKIVVSQEYKTYLYHIFAQQIRMAELAVIQLNQKHYVSSLEDIKKNFTTYLASGKEGEKKILAIMDELQKVRLLPEMPDIRHLSAALHQKSDNTSGNTE